MDMNKPVAWMHEDEPWFDGDKWHKKFKTTMSEQVAIFKSGTIEKPIPLYTHPHSAESVKVKELTDEEKWEIFTHLKRSPDLRTDMIRFADSILRKAGA